MKVDYASSGTGGEAPMDHPVTQIDPVPRVSIQAFCESPDIAAIVNAGYFGGTSLLIVVGVAMDTVQQIEAQLVMRNYEGFVKKGKLRSRRYG